MTTLSAQIQDPSEVAMALAAMRNPNCGHERIHLYDFSVLRLKLTPAPPQHS